MCDEGAGCRWRRAVSCNFRELAQLWVQVGNCPIVMLTDVLSGVLSGFRIGRMSVGRSAAMFSNGTVGSLASGDLPRGTRGRREEGGCRSIGLLTDAASAPAPFGDE